MRSPSAVVTVRVCVEFSHAFQISTAVVGQRTAPKNKNKTVREIGAVRGYTNGFSSVAGLLRLRHW